MSHWYTKKGESKYEVPMASDPTKMRATTLRDARKPENQWICSVTTIKDEMMGKGFLVKWLQEGVAMAAASMPEAERASMEPDELARKILLDADEYSEQARVKGQLLHDAMEQYARDRGLPGNPEIRSLMEPAVEWFDANVKEVYFTEQTFVGDGYAGKVDLVAQLKDERIFVIDFKTRKRGKPVTKKEKESGLGKFGKYDDDIYQLAAYRGAIADSGIVVSGCANLLIDSSNPTPIEFRVHANDTLDRYYRAWCHKVADWQLLHDYYPESDKPGVVTELVKKSKNLL